MRKYGILLLAGVFVFSGLVTAHAVAPMDTVSFSDTLENVDGDTSGWSDGDGVENLGTNVWSILSGMGTVTATGGNLSHRNTRGIGVWGGELDEIDEQNAGEEISIEFDVPYWVESIELRSLFSKDAGHWELGLDELARVDFFLDNGWIGEDNWTGTQIFGEPGLASSTYDNPLAVDKMIFSIPENGIANSDFVVSKLGVTVTPEPLASVLFLAGGITLVMSRRRRKV
ncbi:MAG: PEP-CTERM sorting domain-containing protein [Candidatus Omnitrophica bacterium]|nr:PEP-CTERM sorting domain-containing protein [Candidatus Omnitrophota bacterium]